MTDVFTPIKRSAIMSRIRGKNTLPELRTRRALSRLGYKFQTHKKSLPGVPDIVIPKLQSAVFVHGCFWHQHPGCSRCSTPSSNKRYWRTKLERNVARFKEVKRALRREGWKLLVVWECQTKNLDRLQKSLGTKLAHRRTSGYGRTNDI